MAQQGALVLAEVAQQAATLPGGASSAPWPIEIIDHAGWVHSVLFFF